MEDSATKISVGSLGHGHLLGHLKIVTSAVKNDVECQLPAQCGDDLPQGGAYFESPEARDFTFRHAYWYRTQVEREIKSLKKSAWNAFIQSDMETESRIQHTPTL